MDLERLLDDARAAVRPVLHVGPSSAPGGSVALLSGSFDPPTVAHVALAEAALVHAERVLLVYSIRSMPKDPGAPGPLLAEAGRLAAIQAVCRSHEALALGISSHGLLVDQVQAARDRFGDAALFLVMGSDKVLQILDPAWYPDGEAALARLFSHATVLYAVRSGEEEALARGLALPANARWRGRMVRLPVSADVAAVSSRVVRERLRRGEGVRGLVPEEVLPEVDLAARRARTTP